MRILVDADACPTAIKEIILRAALRTGTHVLFVANKRLSLPLSPLIGLQQVGQGFDKVDEAIADMAQPGDLVVTADIPLAAKVVALGAAGLSPRGEEFTPENISGRLTMRNMLDELRQSGVSTGGPKPLSLADRNAFANRLDRALREGNHR